MEIPLKPQSPVPLYHQIAEAIHYRIAIGALKPGAALPSLRGASDLWDVNLHTVSRAYRELVSRGLAETRGRSGTFVGGGASQVVSKGQLADFVRDIVTRAQEDHGLAATELARLLLAQNSPDHPAPAVHFVECSLSQCEHHAVEIQGTWNVPVRPWVLGEEEPPEGSILATYFHYHEIRRVWPHRREDLRFLTIQPDPTLPDQVRSRIAGGKGAVTVCEFDEPKAENIVSELALLLPEADFHIEAKVVDRAGPFMENLKDGRPYIFPPRVWAALQEEDRADNRALPLRFFIDPVELKALGEELGWVRRIGVRVA